jgi:hypothetical protein
MVWESSLEIGCGLIDCGGSTGIFIVCQFDPPGNYIGQSPFSSTLLTDWCLLRGQYLTLSARLAVHGRSSSKCAAILCRTSVLCSTPVLQHSLHDTCQVLLCCYRDYRCRVTRHFIAVVKAQPTSFFIQIYSWASYVQEIKQSTTSITTSRVRFTHRPRLWAPSTLRWLPCAVRCSSWWTLPLTSWTCRQCRRR